MLPLRGKWLRYFIGGSVCFLAALWILDGGHQWDNLLSLLSADPQSFYSAFGRDWGIGCGIGASTHRRTLMKLQLGPWLLSWVVTNGVRSWQEQVVAKAIPLLFLGVVIGLLRRGVITSRRLLQEKRAASEPAPEGTRVSNGVCPPGTTPPTPR
jgi:hypothetical protein